jgi:hypothetical protein
MNFIALVICVIAAIWQGYCGDVKWCLIETMLALLNLPFCIKWLKEFFKKEND